MSYDPFYEIYAKCIEGPLYLTEFNLIPINLKEEYFKENLILMVKSIKYFKDDKDNKDNKLKTFWEPDMHFPKRSDIKMNNKTLNKYFPEKDNEDWRKDHPIIIPLKSKENIFFIGTNYLKVTNDLSK